MKKKLAVKSVNIPAKAPGPPAAIFKEPAMRPLVQFMHHWDSVYTQLVGLLNDPHPDSYVVNKIRAFLDRLLELPRDNRVVGNFLLDTTHSLIMHFSELCKDPPAWLVERASIELEAPCFMLRGKLDPKFIKFDDRLKWGSKLGRRGKSQLDVQATVDVLRTLQDLMAWREAYDDNAREDYYKLHYGVIDWDSSYWRQCDMYKRAAKLPPLTASTRNAWWPVINGLIRITARLPKKLSDRLAARLGTPTPASIMNEHIKDCRKAFFRLVP